MNRMLQRENLSAYLDNELSPADKALTEERMLGNPSLKQEYDGLKFVKESIGNLTPLPQDEFFYTRLQERLKENSKSKFFFLRKPVLVFGTLSLILMAVFRFEPDILDDFITQQKEHLTDLYSANLQPLLYTAGFSSEDLFNFAFNNILPLNKESDQILSFGTDASGKGIIEVKSAGFSAAPVSFKTFVATLGLKEAEIAAVDSILNSYTDEIATAVLVNENNTVAVNSNLWEYKNALRADLFSYITSVNKNVGKVYAPDVTISPVELKKLAGSIRNVPKSDLYYLISSDTIFSRQLDVDVARFTSGMNDMDYSINNTAGNLKVKVDFKKDLTPSGAASTNRDDLQVVFDSNYCRVVVPKAEGFAFVMPELDSMLERLDTLTSSIRQFSVTVKIDTPGKRKEYKYKMKSVNPDSIKNFVFNGTFPGGKGGAAVFNDSVFNQLHKFFQDSLSAFRSYNFKGESLDSPAKLFNFNWGDSMAIKFNAPDNLKKELELLRKEMNRFREEMENFRREVRPNKKAEKKPIEI